MEEIKALNSTAGQGIENVLIPTKEILTPLLLKNKTSILSIPRKEVSYGSNPRQKLDIYLSPQQSDKTPILVFFYGGGLVRGDKVLPLIPDGLVYHNLGSFFAQRGITTVIADYRRVNSEIGGEDAVFPSGGDDVSLVLKWLEGSGLKGSGNFVIMGNSAGGVHISTFLLAPQYLEQRRSLVGGKKGLKLVGGIEVGVPFHFKFGEAGRKAVLKTYYGDDKEVEEKCPYGLLEAVARTGKSRDETGIPDLLLILGEFDPEGEISQPMRDFNDLAQKTWPTGVDFRTIKGHNHISPPLTLLAGDAEGEKWGEEVAQWIEGLNK